MVRSILSFLGVAILVVAVYKIFGGDIGLALSTVADIFIQIVTAGSDILIKLVNSFL